jgi:hypothetical protein
MPQVEATQPPSNRGCCQQTTFDPAIVRNSTLEARLSATLPGAKTPKSNRAHAPPFVKLHTGLPILRALSARFSTISDPGNTITPIGGAASVRLFFLKNPASLCRVQSGLKAIYTTFRFSVYQAAMRSALLRPAHRAEPIGMLSRTLPRIAQMQP